MDIKPCPFCGGRASIKPIRDIYGNIYSYHLSHTCKDTKPHMIIKCNGLTKEILIQGWNKRYKD